jgi:adenylate cyclase
MSAAFLLAIMMWLGWLGPFSRLAWEGEEAGRDALSRLLEPTPERDDLIFLGIDDATMALSGVPDKEIGRDPVLGMLRKRYPWSRRVWAAVVDRLGEAGARVIILDVIFASPSEDPEADAALAAAVARHRDKVVLASFWGPMAGGASGLGEPLPDLVWADEGDTATGFVNFWPDARDGVVRQADYRIAANEVNMLERAPGEPVYESLAAAVGRKLGGEVRDGGQRLRFAVREVDGERSLSAAYPPESLYEIFVPELWERNYGNGRRLAGKVVMVGPAAPHFQDQHATPSGVLLGAQLHLQALGCLLEDGFWKEAPRWLEWVVLVGMAVLGALLVLRVRNPLVVLALVLVLAVGYLFACWYGSNASGILFAGVPGVLGLFPVVLGGETAEYLVERARRKQLHQQLRRSVSPDVADAMVRAPEGYFDAARGGRRRVAVLFSDVRDFTARAEQMEPELLVRQLNEYFAAMVVAVFRAGGTIDKFIGDAVMAVWGGLDDRDESEMAENSLESALGMVAALERLNAKWAEEGLERFEVGIGIHIGEAVVGEIGSMERSDFTAIGDAVNVASRIEGMTKTLGLPLLVSDQVASRVEARLCPVGSFRVKGRRGGLAMFTSVHGDTEAWEEAMELVRRGEFGLAAQMLEALPDEGPLARVAEFYQRRIKDWQAKPPRDWDGIVTLESK